MPTCNACGKKGLFLKLNARGLCKECAEKAKEAPKSSQIALSFKLSDEKAEEATRQSRIVLSINDLSENSKLGHEDERRACQYFIDKLVERGKDASLFKIEHRSENYTSLIYDEFNDFIRIKITKNVSWISIALTDEDQQKHMNDPLFDHPEGKDRRHWISYFLTFDQLERYLEVAENACYSMPIGTERAVTNQEKVIADYLYDLFISCGAEPENMYYYLLAQEFEILYKCGAGSIRFKAYAKKQGGYLIMDNDYRTAKLKGEKNRIAFTELSELDCLKAKLIPIKIERGNEMAKYYKERYLKYVK